MAGTFVDAIPIGLIVRQTFVVVSRVGLGRRQRLICGAQG